jgi:hypothetical protein
MVERLAGEGIRLGLPLPFFLLQPFPFLSSRARVLPLLSSLSHALCKISMRD